MELKLAQTHASPMVWYCARTQPRHEHIAAGGVRARLGLEVFNPRLRMERATRRGVVRLIEPLFPCYIFIRCNLADNADAIRHVTGISSLVRFGQQVPAVADETIEELRQCFELDEPMGVEDGLKAGVEVLVADGPFMGTRGLVVRAMPGRQRVQILLDFLGRTTLTEVARTSLTVESRRMADLIPALAVSAALQAAIAA